jgi:hypothetical protein
MLVVYVMLATTLCWWESQLLQQAILLQQCVN